MARGQFTFGRPPTQYDQQYLARLVGEIENWTRGFEGRTAQYDVTNFTEAHTLDAAAATLDELRQVVATLVNDLKTIGLIR